MTNEAAPAGATVAPIDGEFSQKSPWRRRLTLLGAAAVLLAAAIVVPPLIGIGRYQRQVTSMMSRAMGRPVHLSSVELRLLPRPGFVLHDLAVSEDPAFGAEPVLSARTVVASVALFSLWKGRPQIDRVSVDEASLNLVRDTKGRWNLESLMTGGVEGVAPESSGAGKPSRLISASFPYLEATNCRVNFKNGVEKTPFSLVDSDLSLWQDEPGAWRVRLRGQPVRTDMEMSLGDTGEVRMEASLRSAARLRDMPLKLAVEWRDAQLGQLSRLLTGSDAGWRGEVTADIDVLGSPESAQTKARLRAVQVRREEFAPDTPLDFDANCNFRYQHSQNAFHNASCDTAIGNGLLHLKAELPGSAGDPEAMLEVNEVPLQVGLDLLRTVRSGFAPGISARGTANGSLSYKVVAAAAVPLHGKKVHGRELRGRDKRGAGPEAGSPFTGSIAVKDGVLRGGGLKEPLSLPVITLTPAVAPLSPDATDMADGAGTGVRLETKFTIALPLETARMPGGARGRTRSSASLHPESPTGAGTDPTQADSAASAPPATIAPVEVAPSITVIAKLGAVGFQTRVTGTAGAGKLRDLAYAAGLPRLEAVDQLSGGSADFALSASGPWIPSELAEGPLQANSAAKGPSAAAEGKSLLPLATPGAVGADVLSGALQLHHLQWKPPYLPRAVDLPQGTVTLAGGVWKMNSEFSFGPAKDAIQGTVAIAPATDCKVKECEARVQLHFGAVDAAVMQAALLSPPEQKTLLSPLLDEVDRMRSSGQVKWPEATLTVDADSVALGPAILRKVSVELRVKAAEMELKSWEAQAFGGAMNGTGHFAWVGDKPEYSLEGTFARLSPSQVGALMGSRWSGGALSGSGKVTLGGLDWKDLEASAVGELKFDWLHGALGLPAGGGELPSRFDTWSGDAVIAGGRLALGKNALTAGRKAGSLTGVAVLGGPVKLSGSVGVANASAATR